MCNKKAEFEALCKEVRECRICENVKFSPYLKNSDFLKNEVVYNKETDEPYINKWNDVYGSLDAEIMIIGQDYGAFDDNNSPTDDNLNKLISEFILHGNNSTEKIRIFQTNLANCYRQKKSTGKFNTGCLALCAYKYMGRLIKIISPKVIIVLGQTTFEALAFCDGADLICTNPYEKQVDSNFSTIIKKNYELKFKDGNTIPVFPVYHPGSNGNRNRSEQNQKTDWQRIRKYLGEVKIL